MYVNFQYFFPLPRTPFLNSLRRPQEPCYTPCFEVCWLTIPANLLPRRPSVRPPRPAGTLLGVLGWGSYALLLLADLLALGWLYVLPLLLPVCVHSPW